MWNNATFGTDIFHEGIFHAGFPVLDVEMTEQMKAEFSAHLAKCGIAKQELFGHSFC